jgi:Tol biopolymer transport system component
VAIDGSDERQVAAGESSGLDWNPVWSPDGEFLYFLSDRGGRVGIWRAAMYRGGSSSVGGAVAMGLDADRAASLAISADGRRLAWSTAEWSPSIMRIDYDADTRTARGNPVPVRAGPFSFRCAQPSPDGTLLAGAADQPQSDIYVVGTSGGAPNAITQDGANESCPRWSPDGTRIAFHTNAEGANRIWIARADGTVLHQSRTADEQSYPVWAPDSRSVAVVNQQRSEIDFYDVAPDGSLTKREGVTDIPRGFVPSGWSPDGSEIAGTAAGALWFYQVAARTFDRLMPGSHPTWLSSGSRLIFASEGRLILLDVPSRYMREILAVPDLYLDTPILSADDRQLYFSRNAPESNLWLATLR